MDDAANRSALRRVIASAVVAALVAAALVMVINSRRAPSAGRSFAETRSLLSTDVTLTVVAPDEPTARAHLAAGFDRIVALDAVLSAHRPDSELARLNAEAAEKPVAVSEDLFRVVETGVAMNSRTHGAFDIAVAPLLDLWRTCGRQNRLPSDEELAATLPLIGAGRIRLAPSARTIRFPADGMRLDLGGLGKGYCADEVARLLVKRGVKDALVSMSGDIHALGRRENGLHWRVGIQDPRKPDSPDAIITVLELSDRGVSTSGNYQRFVTIGGRRYSHIVDPRTGRTAESVPSVTVIAENTLTTDIMDTALDVLGVQEGLAVLKGMPGVEAMFITFDANNEPIITRTAGFSKYESLQTATHK